MILTEDMKTWLADHQEDLKQLIRDLCAIPAPSHHEERRAEFCKAWFEANGGKDVYIDEALNAVCPYHVTEDGPVMVFMAHTDTVFPDMEPMPFLEDETTFRCPGVCDDTTNLAVLMLCAKYFMEHNIKPRTGMLFVANSCEEGLGNLKGCRQIAADYGNRMVGLATIDGACLEELVHVAVGSHRYQVTVKTEGGHSFGSFGKRNAIAYLASMIDTLYDVKVPQEGTSKTTYNVGIISGGTSVNTIAQEASMLYEYRSDNYSCLMKMKKMFEAVVEAYRAMGITVEVELVGERPCANGVDPQAHQALMDLAADSIRRVTGLEPDLRSGSTDCNIPLSLGIPAVCIGVCRATGVHTREECLDLTSLPTGFQLCMDFMCHFFD